MEHIARDIVQAMNRNAPFWVTDIQHSDLVVGRLLGRSPTGRLVLLYERVELDTRRGAGNPVYSGLIQRLEQGQDRRIAMHGSSPLAVRSETPIQTKDSQQIEWVIATG